MMNAILELIAGPIRDRIRLMGNAVVGYLE